MPLFARFEICGAECAVWKVDESLEEIISCLDDSQVVEEAMSYNSAKRRLEYLASRMLLRHVLGDNYEHVQYRVNGKPFLPVSGKYLSISHTGNYVAVALSACNDVGIDIEKVGDKVVRIRNKFLSDEEIACIDDNCTMYDVLVRWSAKESIYKIVGDEAYNYREMLATGKFDCRNDGSLLVRFRRSDGTYECFDVMFRIEQDFVLTFAVRL